MGEYYMTTGPKHLLRQVLATPILQMENLKLTEIK